MTYEEALTKVNNRLRFGIKPGLKRISELTELLGNPQNKLKFIHVAGTNGKGSTCALISSSLTACGFKTGLYTSPYVLEFRERFQIDGEMIEKDQLIEAVKQVDRAAARLEADGKSVSEFEFITAAAFLWFYQSGCDYVVLEVGLGGRFDATNVISVPEVAVIMQIDLDHTAILGDRIEQIAFEKAGIIKPGGKVVLYPCQETAAVSEISRICRERNAALIQPDIESLEIKSADIGGSRFVYEGIEITTSFAGAHQILNAVTAYTALETLLGAENMLKYQEKLLQGFKAAYMPARMEIISKKPLILMDGGHNPGCAAVLCRLLEDFTKGYSRTAVMGMMEDKDVRGVLKILGPIFDRIITVDIPMPRAMPAEKLADIAKDFCGNVSACGDIEKAVKILKETPEENSISVVCGSFYLAGEVREKFIAAEQ